MARYRRLHHYASIVRTRLGTFLNTEAHTGRHVGEAAKLRRAVPVLPLNPQHSGRDPSTLTPPLKNVVLGIVGREADPQTYGQLMTAGSSSHNPLEVQTYFASAFGAKDPALAQQSLNAALALPPQYSSFAPIIVAIVGQDHPALAWSFLKAHQDKLFAGLSEFDRVPYITGIAESFWRGVPADDIQAYMDANVPAAAKAQVAKAMEDVQRSLDDRTRLLPQIDATVTARVER